MIDTVSKYAPSILIIVISVFLAMVVDRIGTKLHETLMLEGGELPVLSKSIFELIQHNLMIPMIVGGGVSVGVILFLIGQDKSRPQLHFLASTLAWVCLVVFTLVLMIAFALPFMFLAPIAV